MKIIGVTGSIGMGKTTISSMLRLVGIPIFDSDKYVRTIGELFKNGVNIQELIVEKGYGKIYEKYAYQCEWSKR